MTPRKKLETVLGLVAAAQEAAAKLARELAELEESIDQQRGANEPASGLIDQAVGAMLAVERVAPQLSDLLAGVRAVHRVRS
jgi:hypothetical protein